jgi:hypothetical protein
MDFLSFKLVPFLVMALLILIESYIPALAAGSCTEMAQNFHAWNV